MIFRKLKPIEYEKLIKLWEKSKLPFKPNGRDSKENIIKQLNISTNGFIVAENNANIIGAIIASHNGRKGWINRLAVHPDYRKKGIAAALIKEAENFLQSEGIEIFAALIEGWNFQSKNLFEKNNYNEFEGIHYFTKRLKKDV